MKYWSKTESGGIEKWAAGLHYKTTMTTKHSPFWRLRFSSRWLRVCVFMFSDIKILFFYLKIYYTINSCERHKTTEFISFFADLLVKQIKQRQRNWNREKNKCTIKRKIDNRLWLDSFFSSLGVVKCLVQTQIKENPLVGLCLSFSSLSFGMHIRTYTHIEIHRHEFFHQSLLIRSRRNRFAAIFFLFILLRFLDSIVNDTNGDYNDNAHIVSGCQLL